MRVVVLNPYARNVTYSGPVVFMDRLFQGVAGRCQVLLLCAGSDQLARRTWPVQSAALIESGNLSARDQGLWVLRTLVWLLRNRRRYDIVHLHGAYLFNLLPALAAILLGRPYVVLPLAEDGDLRRRALTSPAAVVAGRFRRTLVTRAARGLALTEGVAGELQYWGLAPDRVRMQSNVVDVHRIRPPGADARHSLSRLVFIGAVGRRKGAAELLQAVTELQGDGVDVRLDLVGPVEDELRPVVDEAVARLGAEVVVEHGYQSDVLPALSRAFLLVLPSAQEGLPGALLEALAAGVPAIVTDVGAMAVTVRDAGAGEVVSRNPAAIALAVQDYVEDEARWREESGRARKYAVERFGVGHVQDVYLSVLGELA